MSLHVCFSKENSQSWKAVSSTFKKISKWNPQILKNKSFSACLLGFVRKDGERKEEGRTLLSLHGGKSSWCQWRFGNVRNVEVIWTGVLVVNLEESQKQLVFWRIYSQTERQSKTGEIGSIIACVRNQIQASQQSQQCLIHVSSHWKDITVFLKLNSMNSSREASFYTEK